MIRGVLFDMDGVLLDSERLGMAAFPAICARYGYQAGEALFQKLLGTTNDLSRDILVQTFGDAFPFDEVMGELDRYRTREAEAGRMPLKKGLEACMAGLRARGVRRALATSSDRAVVEHYIAAIPQMQGVFDALVCGAEGGRSKPAPDIYLTAAKRLGLTPEECVGVEASENGLRSLTAAGVVSVMLPDLLPYGERFQGLVRYRLDDLSQLCPLIDRLNAGARPRG